MAKKQSPIRDLAISLIGASPRGGQVWLIESGKEKGFALLLALVIIVSLSALALSVAALTESRIRLGRTTETQMGVYYASLAGLEEARGRLNASAPDTVSSSLPAHIHDVLYIVNSRTQDPVRPTDPSSPYYDSEYAQEFPGGFGAATVLPNISSDQPGAGTASSIPYKWVRITLKTEYSSNQDINQDGVLDSTSRVNWDGSNQDIGPFEPGEVPVYKLTALAVDQSGIRKLVQAEVAGVANVYASAAVATAGSATLTGNGNLTVNGYDVEYTRTYLAIPGLMTGTTASVNGAVTIQGSPSAFNQNTSPFPQSASALLTSMQNYATPILNADPNHVTTSATTYLGTNAMLAIVTYQWGTHLQPEIVYADKSLTLSGTVGMGVLLVNGDLSIKGGFSYRGMIIVNGNVTLVPDSTGSISIAGTILSSGNVTADSSGSSATSLNVVYDSHAVTEVMQMLPKSVLAARELSH